MDLQQHKTNESLHKEGVTHRAATKKRKTSRDRWDCSAAFTSGWVDLWWQVGEQKIRQPVRKERRFEAIKEFEKLHPEAKPIMGEK